MFPAASLQRVSLVAGLALALLASPAVHAQSEASVAVSALPLASVVVGSAAAGASAGAAVGASVAVPVALSVTGAVLAIRAVEASAHGTVWVLERLSDGARVSVRVSSRAAGAASIGVGALVTVTTLASGALLVAAGEVVALVPNALGEALLADERVTR